MARRIRVLMSVKGNRKAVAKSFGRRAVECVLHLTLTVHFDK